MNASTSLVRCGRIRAAAIRLAVGFAATAACLDGATSKGDPPALVPDAANEIVFPAQTARFVRFVIAKSISSQPCIDELEVYGKDVLSKTNLALAERGAKASASSCLPGYAIHKIEHLNDGKYGNSFSWIAAGSKNEWAQIELPEPAEISKVVVSRDRAGKYVDRVPAEWTIELSSDGKQWTEVRDVEVRFHWLASEPLVPDPPLRRPPAADALQVALARQDPETMFRYAFVAEELAWLKTYGRADLDRRLTDTPYREKKYPAHAADDRLPLPPLRSAPRLDGNLDDVCWAEASRGVARVADAFHGDAGPLIETAVFAGIYEDELCLGVETDRLLSDHVAVVATGGGRQCGVLMLSGGSLEFRRYAGPAQRQPRAGARRAELVESLAVKAAVDPSQTRFEVCLPLAWFPEWRERGIRVGLGAGGKHTDPAGRPVYFLPSPLAIAQVGPCLDVTFRVRASLAASEHAVTLRGNTAQLQAGLTLQPGDSQILDIPARPGEIGPQFHLEVDEGGNESYSLELFRYDPLERTLTLMESMLDRFRARGLEVGHERAQAAEFRKVQRELLASARNAAREREAFFQARLAKRALILRDPDMSPLERILFVKRQAFEPSHNYSVLLDSRWRPGGGICMLKIPRRDQAAVRSDPIHRVRAAATGAGPHECGRYEPTVTVLFDAGEGIARNAMADFDCDKIYFAYRPSEDGYYHIHVMSSDGSGLKQLTFGPFHDYWPCPLPDGGIAMISTRCTSRYLCWRPQAAVLFRMEADGKGMRPLSFANLTEWGPSVTRDGRIIWQRSEYQDKGADYSHTLWAIRPDGTKPELVFGNTIVLPQGYANGRQVPGSEEICCTLISHFGDLNGPIALCDTDRGRFNPEAIECITPEVPWPGFSPKEECFRDPFPVATDYFLVSHAPRDVFGLYVIDRYGNRELLYLDPTIGSVCPTLFRPVLPPPVLNTPIDPELAEQGLGQFSVVDVYRGIEATVPRGRVKYIRVAQEVRADLIQLPDGSYQKDHTPFMSWYATPVDKIRGPYGWPSYVAKGTWGLAPVEEDGSANFYAPASKVLYFQLLDENFNEIQRMRSVVQLQPGETRSCIGCHEDRRDTPMSGRATASSLRQPPRRLEPEPWGSGPFSYERVVQPVWDAKCAGCHNADDKAGLDLTGTLDADRIPASYRTLITQGWVNHFDWGYKSGENLKAEPLSFGTVKSKIWQTLDRDHHGAKLTRAEMRAVKCWTDLNCPLWPDYQERSTRPATRMFTAGLAPK